MDLVAATLLVALLATRRSVPALVLAGLPATLMHELAHWTVALATGSQPSGFTLWPRRDGDRWRLGSVQFVPGTFSAAVVAMAPALLLGPLAYWGLWLREPGELVEELLCGLAFGYAAWGCVPSSTDFTIAFRYPAGLVAVALIAFSAGAMLGLV